MKLETWMWPVQCIDSTSSDGGGKPASKSAMTAAVQRYRTHLKEDGTRIRVPYLKQGFVMSLIQG
jgi:hypothetical protein